MIYKYTRHTALEILKAIGMDSFPVGEVNFSVSEVFGKARVIVGGVSVAGAKHMVKLGGADSLEVVVGVKTYEVSVEDSTPEEAVLTDHAKEVIKERCAIATEKANTIQEAKKAKLVEPKDESESVEE